MSLSTDQANESWIQAPLRTPTFFSAIRELGRADWPEFGAMWLFAIAGLNAVLFAVEAFGPGYDYGSILMVTG